MSFNKSDDLMWGLIWASAYRFFNNMTQPLNRAEKDQPPPLTVQRDHLLKELYLVNKKIELQMIRSAKLDAIKPVAEPPNPPPPLKFPSNVRPLRKK